MSDPEFEKRFEKYLEQYTEFVGLVVESYNLHKWFCKSRGRDKMREYRRTLKKLRTLEKSMLENILDIYTIESKGFERLKEIKEGYFIKNKGSKPPSRKGQKVKKHGFENQSIEGDP